MDPIYSIAQLEENLKLYRDGIITDTAMRELCHQVGLPPLRPLYRPPQEKTRLKHEARRLNRELSKLHALQSQRLKVEALRKKLDDLQYDEQCRTR